VIDLGITVHENIPEGNDPLMFTDFGGCAWINLG
jgi:hypothetical protein